LGNRREMLKKDMIPKREHTTTKIWINGPIRLWNGEGQEVDPILYSGPAKLHLYHPGRRGEIFPHLLIFPIVGIYKDNKMGISEEEFEHLNHEEME